MTPRDATVNSGGRALITGVLPAGPAMYVWFGDLAIVPGTLTEQGLEVTIPTVVTSGVVDIDVQFATSDALGNRNEYVLTLKDAFTFHPVSPSPPEPAPPTATTVPSPTPTSPPPATTPTTTQPPATMAPPVTQPPATAPPPATTPPTTQVPGTQPPNTQPPSTQPPGTSPPPPTAAPVPPTPTEIRRGDLTLRTPSGSTALGRLNVQSWPTPGCTSAACTTVRF